MDFFLLVDNVAFECARPGVDCCMSIVLTAGRGHASFLEMLIFNEL